MAGVRVFFILVLLSGFSGFAFSAFAVAQQPGSLDETVFFSDLEDIPLMPGLTELPDEALFFDKPEGRIVEQTALMEGVSREDVLVFYGGVLTQLGWGRVSESRFFRDREYLELLFDTQDGADFVKITVRPAL
ncbi:MAG: hypothetical protein KA099_00870 [Alphaproteobacteria bacterium]|jgi:hypothetical protein|nr:hypothetical protein [Alphaproteobacteria bacterium]MBK9586228.1 hypothetical protein [Alphaproteobacteria bacterium]MBP7758154.1 hypothetical protein [Alphaproteobacteria bacterium]MBP7761413.1 hypothetical protein [Alphaproteobacteria bacterium]MBP7903852.1 hypothetical protein [Alphaproteobacteria bacterium]